MRLLFFCCPEPRMLKWLYAGNAFDEWTYTPCSAASYKVDSLSLSVALRVIQELWPALLPYYMLNQRERDRLFEWLDGVSRGALACAVSITALAPLIFVDGREMVALATAVIEPRHKENMNDRSSCEEGVLYSLRSNSPSSTSKACDPLWPLVFKGSGFFDRSSRFFDHSAAKLYDLTTYDRPAGVGCPPLLPDHGPK